MDYRELHSAVMDAYRRRTYAECYALLDAFTASAGGEELAQALILKAGLIAAVDGRRSAEGLALIEEALPLLAEHAETIVGAVSNAIALCYVMGDVGKAESYEVMGHRLLQQYAGHPQVTTKQAQLHWHMGLIAGLKKQYAMAYWHYVQGLQCLLSPCDDPAIRCRIMLFYLSIAVVSLKMGRHPEAEDALEKAANYASDAEDQVDLAVTRAEYLHSRGRFAEAGSLLKETEPHLLPTYSPDTAVQLHLISARVALSTGEVRQFHASLDRARTIAVEHSLDYYLCELQRLQREPEKLEVVK